MLTGFRGRTKVEDVDLSDINTVEQRALAGRDELGDGPGRVDHGRSLAECGRSAAAREAGDVDEGPLSMGPSPTVQLWFTEQGDREVDDGDVAAELHRQCARRATETASGEQNP